MAGMAVVPTASVTTMQDDRAFMLRAACRTEDPDLFYPSGETVRSDIARAKRVCARCPVRWECGRLAFETGEQFGVWGGLTADERRAQVRRAAAARAAAGQPAGQETEPAQRTAA